MAHHVYVHRVNGGVATYIVRDDDDRPVRLFNASEAGRVAALAYCDTTGDYDCAIDLARQGHSRRAVRDFLVRVRAVHGERADYIAADAIACHVSERAQGVASRG